MEYLEGELLSAYATRKGPLSLADFTPIAAQILKAIGYAHEQGLMHRDLKPSNIMLCIRRGRANFVKILDFGMAKLVDDERDITSEQIVGTATYLSPEQIRGEPIDARVDVYALGVMFYALLAGRLPFIADNNAALLYKHVHEPPPPLAELLPAGHDIPSGLVALVQRCLAKDVGDRPSDANAVVAALIACVPGELFHLPAAEGGVATPSSSYAVLPASLTIGPEDFSSRLTRPVQSLRPRTGQAATDEADPSMSGSGLLAANGRARTGRVPQVRPATLPPIAIDPPAEGGKLWLVLAGVVVLALLGLGGWLVSHAGRTAEPVQDLAALDERRLAARLDQVEFDLRGGDLERARADLDAAEPGLADVPQLRIRADVLRRRLDVESKIAAAPRAREGWEDRRGDEHLPRRADPRSRPHRRPRGARPAQRAGRPTDAPTPARARRAVRGRQAQRTSGRGPAEVVAPAKPEAARPPGEGEQDDGVFLPD
jgi:hypothetical protein